MLELLDLYHTDLSVALRLIERNDLLDEFKELIRKERFDKMLRDMDGSSVVEAPLHVSCKLIDCYKCGSIPCSCGDFGH